MPDDMTDWRPDRSRRGDAGRTPVPLPTAVGRGLRNRCPVCGEGRVFRGWLSVVPQCGSCGTKLGELRADDAPPYVVVFITAHVVGVSLLWVEQAYSPSAWVEAAIFVPMTVALVFGLLRPVKGALVGVLHRLTPADPAGDE